jgi:hypothetical protein
VSSSDTDVIMLRRFTPEGQEDPHKEVPHEATKTAKDQKASSRAVPREGMDHIHVISACSSAEQEDKDGR